LSFIIIHVPFGLEPLLRLPGRKFHRGRKGRGKEARTIPTVRRFLAYGRGWGGESEGWLLRGAGKGGCFGARVLVRIS
jgi:hypothetical protein